MYLKSYISVGISFGVLFCRCNVLVYFISSPDLLVCAQHLTLTKHKYHSQSWGSHLLSLHCWMVP